ncbi:hypothetical protein J6P92_00215 [bacterium]|nr:hypothetical protein [bacterium]
MKKIILILSIFLFQLQALAFEDYIITSDYNVISVKSSDENIVFVKPLYSINNYKDTILLKSKNAGKVIITIETSEKEKILNVEVKNDETFISQSEGLNYYVLDIPSKKPVLRGE